MLSRSEADDILWQWIRFCKPEQIEYKKKLWLLSDYFRGNLNENFYRRHVDEIKDLAGKFDTRKAHVNDIMPHVRKVIKEYDAPENLDLF